MKTGEALMGGTGVQPNAGASTVTIALSKAVPTGKTAVVAWFVAN